MVFCQKVQDHIRDLVTEHFNNDVEVVMRDPILFGDFRMALQEEETRIYEDIQDYEAAKALFQVWTGLTLSMGSRFLGALLGGDQHCTGAQEAELGRIPMPLSQGSERRLVSSPVITMSSGAWNDLRSVLNAQTPGLAPSEFPFFKPMKSPRVPVHSQIWEPLS